MLKQFPLRLTIRIFIAILIISVAVYYLFFSMYVEIRKTASAIRYHYSGANEKIQSRLEKERELLADLEQKITSQPNLGQKSDGYYDFIREALEKRSIQTIRITFGEQVTKGNVRQQDFSVTFTSTYHTVGMIISDLEGGPFFCSVKSVHLVSKSLIDNTLEVSMVFSFRRMAG